MASIMIVEDSLDSCEVLVTYLQKVGHTVRCHPNGKEALVAVITDPPDVIILDLLMPEMDGPTFLEVIRSYLRLQSMPVVVLTALTDSPMVERARHLKVNSVLAKGKASLEDTQRAAEEALHRLPG
jgi:CheY-like chemotaxis protein